MCRRRIRLWPGCDLDLLRSAKEKALMTDRTYPEAAQIDPAFMTDVVFSQIVSCPEPAASRQHFAPPRIQPTAAVPNLAVIAEELQRLQLLCAAQSRRLDELEARGEHLSWPTRSAYAHLEIDP